MIWFIAALALTGLAAMPLAHRWPARAMVIVALSAAAALGCVQWGPAADVPVRQVSWSAAGLALFWSVGSRFTQPPLASFMSMAALLFGVIAAVIEAVILVMRAAFALVDVLHGYPSTAGSAYGFSAHGLLTIGLLLVASIVSLGATGPRRRLTAASLVLTLMGAAWASLMTPSFSANATGGYERAGGTVPLMLSWSILLLVTSIVTQNVDARRKWRWASSPTLEPPATPSSWPGLRLCFIFAAIVIAWSACLHLVVPVKVWTFGHGASVLATALSTLIAAIACARALTDYWSSVIADCTLGLFSLTCCALTVLVVPDQNRPLVEQYPIVFNAMMIGLALAAALWTWLTDVWQQQLDHGMAWTTTGRLIPFAGRHAFLAAALAWVSGVVMMIWPRLSTVATADESFARVTAGVGGNLLLLLVTLWSSRRLNRPAFRILTTMVVLSTAGFLLVRMLPYRSYVG